MIMFKSILMAILSTNTIQVGYGDLRTPTMLEVELVGVKGQKEGKEFISAFCPEHFFVIIPVEDFTEGQKKVKAQVFCKYMWSYDYPEINLNQRMQGISGRSNYQPPVNYAR